MTFAFINYISYTSIYIPHLSIYPTPGEVFITQSGIKYTPLYQVFRHIKLRETGNFTHFRTEKHASWFCLCVLFLHAFLLIFPGDFPCGRLAVNVISALSSRSAQANLPEESLNDTINNSLLLPKQSGHVDSTANHSATNNVTWKPTLSELPSWAFSPTLPTIQKEVATGQRIVGGNEVTPGEIPWQVGECSALNRIDL